MAQSQYKQRPVAQFYPAVLLRPLYSFYMPPREHFHHHLGQDWLRDIAEVDPVQTIFSERLYAQYRA